MAELYSNISALFSKCYGFLFVFLKLSHYIITKLIIVKHFFLFYHYQKYCFFIEY